jgi:hypothetical protein
MVERDYVVFAYVESTLLTEDGNHVEITEHNILNLSDVIRYSSRDDNSQLKEDSKEDFKKMFDSWKNPNQYE